MNKVLGLFDSVRDGQKASKSSLSRGVAFCSPVLSALFVVMLAVLVMAPHAEAQSVQFSYAMQVIGGQGFNNPNGVAVDAAGDVYLVDTGNNQVQEVPAGCIAGQNNASCVLTLPGSYKQPGGVAVDATGDVYIADTGDNAIKEIPAKCSQSSCVLTLGSGFNAPQGVAVAANGDVYVADTGNNAVKEIVANCTANCVLTLPEPPNSPAYKVPAALALDAAGNLYVADTGNNRVLELSGACTTASSCNFILPGSPTQSFSTPSGLAVDANGNLFVAATGDDSIEEISPSCKLSSCVDYVAFNQSGRPVGLAVDRDDNLYVGNTADSQIQMLQTLGVNFDAASVGSMTEQTLTFTITPLGNTPITLGSPVALTGGAKNLDFSIDPTNPGTCMNGDAVTTYSTCTVNVRFTPKYSGLRRGSVELTNTAGAVLAEANVYGTGTGAQVAWNNPAASASTATQIGTGWTRPTDVAVDGAGNVFVADNFNNSVSMVPPGCQQQQCIETLGGGFYNPWGIAIDGADNVYVADTEDNEVKEIPQGCTSASCVITMGGSYNGPQDVAVDRLGNIYVADNFDNAIKEIPAGCTATLFASRACSVKTLGGGFNDPTSVGVDAAGNVYESDINATAIKEIPLSCIEGANNASCVVTLPGEFGKVRRIAFDSAGDIYVADAGSTAPSGLGSAIREIPVGCTTSACVQTLVSGLNVATGIALDDAGNLYIADSYDNDVLEVQRANAPTLSFANAKVGQTSSDNPQTAHLINIGNATLSFAIPQTGSNPSVPAGFNYDSSSTCLQSDEESQSTATVSPGAGCTVAIDFTPTASGNDSGNVVLTDNALAVAPNNTTQQIPLSVTGVTLTATVATLPQASSIGLNETLSDSTLSGGVIMGAGSTQIQGTYSWQNGATTFTTPGTFPEQAIFTPTEPQGYAPITFTVNVTVTSPLTVSQSSLPAAALGVPYSQSLTASGGTAPYTYSITAGVLPQGITLSSAGALSGTPTSAGNFAFTLTVEDAKGATTNQSLTLNVAPASTTTTLTSNLNSVNPGQSFTLTATVANSLTGLSLQPTGTVSFSDNGTVIGTAPVNNGVATYPVTAPSSGSNYSITATYSGDSNFTSSSSASLTVVAVAPLDFTIGVNGGAAGASQTVQSGGSVTYALSVTPTASTYPGAVSFSVTGLPTGATATFTPATLAANAGAQTVNLSVHTIKTPITIAENHSPFEHAAPIFLGSLLLPLLGLRRARKNWLQRGLLVALLMLGGLFGVASLTGCGTTANANLSILSQGYSLTVTATSGTISHSTTVNLNID